ncbi:hypothetical protein [Streptomyces sp. NRRL WC-3742]|uniref:hypothetical protein n=1 Tax=Streptomyces sp. NRRL WC-3742 TaxID=1463934 RepID=UPI00131E45B8|nr:hypothetical protein [Streptomyces sp. NRRL WC-3742]
MPDPMYPIGPRGTAGSHRQRVEKLKRTIDESHGMWGAGDLKYAVADALRLPPPQGDPGRLDGLAASYSTAADRLDEARTKVAQVATQHLPDAWTGQVGEKAAAVVKASADDLERSRNSFNRARYQLKTLATALREAQTLHGQGDAPLREALSLLHDITVSDAPDPFHWDDDKMHTAHTRAKEGIKSILDAAVKAENAGRAAARELNSLAGKALAGRFKNKGLSAADKLVITDTTFSYSDTTLLTPNDVTRAGQFMDRMTEAERARLDALLADTKSPAERAYLMKALAAGHDYEEIKAFDDRIRPHADDFDWLSQRISPVQLDAASGGKHDTGYQGVTWDQGNRNSCVAASTVTARAMVDPLFAFQLTTGGHPGDPAYDNGRAARDRWTKESERVYSTREDTDKDDGMTNPESRQVADDELGRNTGAAYDNRDLHTRDERQAALAEIEKRIDEGKPVPFSCENEHGRHQMVVVARDGDRLEIHNPWGYTIWVNESDFLDNHMQGATDGQYPNLVSVRMPR